MSSATTAVGKIYGLKSAGSGDKLKVTFRVGVRKRFVSEQDKQDNKTQTFYPCIAYGKTAEFINQYFEDKKAIHVLDMEFQTYRSNDAPDDYDDKYIFKVNTVSFVPGTDDGEGGGGNSGGGNRGSNNNSRGNDRGNNGGGRESNSRGGNDNRRGNDSRDDRRSNDSGRGNSGRDTGRSGGGDSYVANEDDLPF